MDAAERLFAQRGYSAVTLRDIATAVGIRHTSLYHHVPGGKEELFVQVTERNLQRHREGLTAALESAEPGVRARLRSAADWLLSQPPMDLIRMVHSDMPEIDEARARQLAETAFESMLTPIATTLEQAQNEGEIEHGNLTLIAGALIGMIESLYAIPAHAIERSRSAMAHDLIDVVLDGLRPRSAADS